MEFPLATNAVINMSWTGTKQRFRLDGNGEL